jgi:hypothetical protein
LPKGRVSDESGHLGGEVVEVRQSQKVLDLKGLI